MQNRRHVILKLPWTVVPSRHGPHSRKNYWNIKIRSPHSNLKAGLLTCFIEIWWQILLSESTVLPGWRVDKQIFGCEAFKLSWIFARSLQGLEERSALSWNQGPNLFSNTRFFSFPFLSIEILNWKKAVRGMVIGLTIKEKKREKFSWKLKINALWGYSWGLRR